MKFLKLVASRYSVRKYLDKEIDENKLKNCIEAARLAPSASNGQPWKYIIIDDIDLKNKIALAARSNMLKINRFVQYAPVIVAIVSEKSNLGTRLGTYIKRRAYHLIDLGISAEHFCLQAAEEGLGTCILGWFNERKIKKLLKIPFSKRLHLLITVGYALNKEIPIKKRKSTQEMSCYNIYK